MSANKGITMTKIPEDLEMKKTSFLLITPTRKSSFRKEVRTSLGRSIKKLKRAFFSEPILRHKSRSCIAPKKLDLAEGTIADAESAIGAKPSGAEDDESVVLDDNTFASANDNTASVQNLESDKYAPEELTLTDIAIALSAVVFIVGVLSALVYMPLYVDLPVSPSLKQHAKSVYDASLNRLDIQGMKLACESRISTLVGYLTGVMQTINEKMLN